MKLKSTLCLLTVFNQFFKFIEANEKMEFSVRERNRSLTDTLWERVGDIVGEAAGDNFGVSTSMNSKGNRIVVGGGRNDIVGTQSGHVKVFEEVDNLWTQVGDNIYGNQTNDYGGAAVSMNSSGDRIVVGGTTKDGKGYLKWHVSVFKEVATTWTQVGFEIYFTKLKHYHYFHYDSLSVAMNSNGNRIVVGSGLRGFGGTLNGYVKVFEEDENNKWVQVGADISKKHRGNQIDYFCHSVAMNNVGNRIAVGASINGGRGIGGGKVIIFEESDGPNGRWWSQVWNDIEEEIRNDYFGRSVSMNSIGNRIVAGSPLNDGKSSGSGHARVFEEKGITWVQVGDNIDGEAAGENFGISVAMNSGGDRIIVGGVNNNWQENGGGYARVFKESDSSYDSAWTQVGNDIDREVFNDYSGISVTINSDGNRSVVGVTKSGGIGYARVFEDPSFMPPAVITSAPTTSAPSANFEGQDFSFSQPTSSFFDNDGQFSIEFNYTLGFSADSLNITLMNTNCTEIDESVPSTIRIGYEKKTNHVHSKQVLLFKQNFAESTLVSKINEGESLSEGSVDFCIKAESMFSGTSMSFKKTNIRLSFDLTQNNFQVANNRINENEIDTSEKNVTSTYGVEACRCTKESYGCDSLGSSPDLSQNALVFICLKPDKNSNGVKIINFDMNFKQDDETKLKAVEFGAEGPVSPAGLSVIQQEDDTFRVVSRIVTILFEKSSFNVTGNAYLAFKTDKQRNLRTSPISGIRLVQDWKEDSAGEGQFNMKLNLAKTTAVDVTKEEFVINFTTVVSMIFGIVVFAIALALFKRKMALA